MDSSPGWRVAIFSIDGTPGALLVEQVEEHPRRLDGQLRAIWIQDHPVLPSFVITDSRRCLATTEADVDETIELAARAFERVA